MNGKTIGELYGLRATEEQEKGYPLEQWFAALTKKTEKELTVADTERMFRQNILREVAARRTIVFLQKDPLEGEVYPGELIEYIVRFPAFFIADYSDELKEIIPKAWAALKETDLLIDEEKKEYADILRDIEELLNR